MRILVGDDWQSGFLDPWAAPGDRRIEVRRWVVVSELEGLFLEHRFDVRRLIDYSREVGPVEVARKVVSRLAETDRNKKFAACGAGVDLETGAPVCFFAPCVPRCAERVVLPDALVWPVAEVGAALEFTEAFSSAFAPWQGWTREMGRALTDLGSLESLVRDTLRSPVERRLPGEPSAIAERRGEPVVGRRLKASVFGYGHYVRTIVLASLPPEIEVVTVHELDPQLAPDSYPAADTCGVLRPDESPDVVFVAGFHHTHAPIAAEALRRGCWVVSEKPLATRCEQLDELLGEWRNPSRYFASFQRRFMAPSQWVLEDLRPSETNPMSYHALVHEVSLPEGHWYHWPSSGSRLLSNGCHWIDHFLWLNDFAAVQTADAHKGPNGEILCELTLENGAYFTMTLTDRGSDRLGVREHTEIRVRDRTAVISDLSAYTCEGPRGIVRQEKFHRLAAHRDMYQAFGRRILAGDAGDSRESIERSARAVLDLESQLDGG